MPIGRPTRLVRFGVQGNSQMKCKTFIGRRWPAVEKQAYDWLARQKPQVELLRSETRMRTATVKVWYDFAGCRPRRPVRAPLGRAA